MSSFIQRGYLREDADIRRNQDQGLLFAYADQGAVGTAQQLAPVLAQHYAPWRYVEGDAQKFRMRRTSTPSIPRP